MLNIPYFGFEQNHKERKWLYNCINAEPKRISTMKENILKICSKQKTNIIFCSIDVNHIKRLAANLFTEKNNNREFDINIISIKLFSEYTKEDIEGVKEVEDDTKKYDSHQICKIYHKILCPEIVCEKNNDTKHFYSVGFNTKIHNAINNVSGKSIFTISSLNDENINLIESFEGKFYDKTKNKF